MQILRMMTSFAILVGNIRKTFIPAQFKWLKPGRNAYDNPELMMLWRSGFLALNFRRSRFIILIFHHLISPFKFLSNNSVSFTDSIPFRTAHGKTETFRTRKN